MRPGEVYRFFSDEADKPKYHLCISLDGCFLYVNSPRTKPFPGDFPILNADVPFLGTTETGQSIISCNYVVTMTPDEYRDKRAKFKGKVDPSLLRKLLVFIEECDAMSEEHLELALDGLGNWC